MNDQTREQLLAASLRHMLSIFLLSLLLLVVFSGRPAVQAQGCTEDVEPNDEPAAAQPISGCAVGILLPEDQDLFSFAVSDPAERWQIDLDGVDGALTRAEIFRVVDNKPTSIFAVQSPNGDRQSSPSLLLTRGDYLLGVTPAGGSGRYQVDLRPAGEIPPSGDVEPNDRREAASPISGAVTLSGDLQGSPDWYGWTLPAGEAGQLWQVGFQAGPGQALNATLYDGAGNRLAGTSADEVGRAFLYDLLLPAGEYLLQIDGDRSTANPYLLTTVATGMPDPNRESEPNDEPVRAQPWSGETAIHGRLAAINDDDSFQLVVTPEMSGDRFDLRLRSTARSQRELCLANPETQMRQCRQGVGEVDLVDLTLPEGVYLVQVDGAAESEAGYTLSRQVTGRAAAGLESEPNDNFRFAASLDANQRAAGRHVGDEWDIYRLEISGPPQLWRLQVVGEGLTRLAYINAAGQLAQTFTGQNQRRMRMSNLYLLPGTHYVGVRGTGGAYNVVAIPLGPPPPGLEREPNSETGQANPLRFDEGRIGLLNEAQDNDFYRFTLPVEETIRLTVTAPDDGNVRTWLDGDGGYLIAKNSSGVAAGAPFVLETRLPPGDYWLRLGSDVISDSPYRLLLERLDPFLPLTDIEPNERPELAGEVPPTFVVRGAVSQNNDIDWYRLPPVTESTPVEIVVPEPFAVAFYDQDGKNITNQFNWDEAARRFSGSVSDEQVTLMRIQGDGPYELFIDYQDGNRPLSEPGPLAVTASLTLESEAVASYWTAGQEITGRLTIRSSAGEQLTLQQEWHAAHYKIRPVWPEEPVTVPAGGTVEVPLTLLIAPDLLSGDYPITVRLSSLDGAAVTAQAILQAAAEGAPVGERRIWPLPETMLGGFNAAASAFGAEIRTTDEDLAERQIALHNGYTALQDGMYASFDDGPLELIVDLAGDEPLPVTGILLNPQGVGADNEKVRLFELLFSLDGQNFSPAMTGELSPTPIEQPFALPVPVSARYAMLRLLDKQSGGRGRIALGEWKVVVSPAAPLITSLNLTDPAYGGYIASTDPLVRSEPDAVSILLDDDRGAMINLDNGQTANWVFGFQHDRAARIERLVWEEVPNADPANRLTTAEVWVSLDSPVGPWRSLGGWDLQPGVSAFIPDEPVWARYVRLGASGPTDEGRFRPLLPDTVRIFEAPVEDSYRSVVGEWGHYNKDGVYEWLTPPPALIGAAADSNDSRPQAEPVTTGEKVNGQVQIGRDVDWYRIDVPAGDNAVVLELSGSPTVDVRVLFENEAGEPLPATVNRVEADRQVITATAPAETTVFFRIEEPPRSVVFSWDTSGSVGAYFDTIYTALATFVEGVTPGREVVNFLPFGEGLLLENWGEEPAALQQALTDYPRDANSSNAETALRLATEALAFRDGTKAIIIITDAESGSYSETAELWRGLAAVRPRVFSMAISSNVTVGRKPANEQDLMQSWAGVNGGYYDFLRTQGEMDVAFERATTWLRRPAGYAFTPRTAFVEPPGPGFLQLLSSSTGEDAAASASLLGETAVELILDASGSMQQPLGDSSRIEVARGVLLDLVENVLPDEIPVALRVFGNREGNFSCRTDLEVPLRPLDRPALAATVSGIVPQTNANTAIGASLALVAEDLAEAPGPKLVILLTDGEETCDGNPEQVIAALRERGIDVRVNIVGFAIDNEALKAEFARWAEVGGGDYFDAADPEELSASLSQALRTPYRVLDGDGLVVAEGLVDGEPVPLPAGVYVVEVLTDPVTVLEQVIVPGDEEIVLRIQRE